MGELKALLQWHGEPLLRYQVTQLLATPVQRIIVVLGHRATELKAFLPDDPRVQAVVNPDFATGKVGSIETGVRVTPEDSSVLILGVDQPRPACLIAQTIDAHQTEPAEVTIAGYGGRRGHPVIFSPGTRAALLAISEETQGLRSVLHEYRDAVRVIDTGDPLALVNLNTPEDYESALRLSSTDSTRAGNQ